MADIVKGPIYNPESKSYFALVKADVQQKFWDTLDVAAAARTHKDVHGRLAIIRTRETHDFVMKNLAIKSPTWIGLRYWCTFKSLQWVDGSKVKGADFQHWQSPWYRSKKTTCLDDPRSSRVFMPVYYEPKNYREKGVFLKGSKNDDAYWRAAGHEQPFSHYLIEFPTGAE
ncbi:C-type lectin domain-containing protein [Magnetospira sp. QH-2]|uniref:C-type lectin domain-containing protein n=1 Tax=Magnetospira sp. (strain QH-2) TaxID=1288970 RepID=UPI0003E81898|nr:C-type lectin domain-containing protein [Magnetospira sp. QH-2]CCQ72905.1 protein of unknown function [Magnetospira sp. QH-2]